MKSLIEREEEDTKSAEEYVSLICALIKSCTEHDILRVKVLPSYMLGENMPGECDIWMKEGKYIDAYIDVYLVVMYYWFLCLYSVLMEEKKGDEGLAFLMIEERLYEYDLKSCGNGEDYKSGFMWIIYRKFKQYALERMGVVKVAG